VIIVFQKWKCIGTVEIKKVIREILYTKLLTIKVFHAVIFRIKISSGWEKEWDFPARPF
jgi:hypothetical protein